MPSKKKHGSSRKSKHSRRSSSSSGAADESPVPTTKLEQDDDFLAGRLFQKHSNSEGFLTKKDLQALLKEKQDLQLQEQRRMQEPRGSKGASRLEATALSVSKHLQALDDSQAHVVKLLEKVTQSQQQQEQQYGPFSALYSLYPPPQRRSRHEGLLPQLRDAVTVAGLAEGLVKADIEIIDRTLLLEKVKDEAKWGGTGADSRVRFQQSAFASALPRGRYEPPEEERVLKYLRIKCVEQLETSSLLPSSLKQLNYYDREPVKRHHHHVTALMERQNERFVLDSLEQRLCQALAR